MKIEYPSNVTFHNLTPHEVTINTSMGYLTVPPDGRVARLAETREPRPDLTTGHDLEGQPITIGITRPRRTEVTGLPRATYGGHHDYCYIVSDMVAQAVPHRADVYSPGELIRDARGAIIACQGLSSYYSVEAYRAYIESVAVDVRECSNVTPKTDTECPHCLNKPSDFAAYSKATI